MQNININRVLLTGNLTKDPELKAIPGTDTVVCSMRIACNGRRRNGEGQWEDQPNFFDITVWGARGENCHRYLTKGRGVAIDGRVRWREFTRQDGSRGQAVDIVADTVQFLGGRDGVGNGSGAPGAPPPGTAEASGGFDSGDFDAGPIPTGPAGEDDIPF